jgi:hypothetical protein
VVTPRTGTAEPLVDTEEGEASVSAYWYGVLTLPALAGCLAALFGVLWFLVVVLTALFSHVKPGGRLDVRARTAVAVATAGRVFVLRLGKWLCLAVTVGPRPDWARHGGHQLHHVIHQELYRQQQAGQADGEKVA